MRLLVSFALIAVCLAGQAPQVVTVSPAVGSQDVALDVGQILVVFDRPMGPAFDFIPVPGKVMPPISGDPLFLSPQMCRIPLDPLKPGVGYGLSLNGFVAKDGTGLAPYVLSFQAAGVAQGGGAPGDPAHPAALCGTWSRQIPNLNLLAHYVLAPDGAVTGGLGPEAKAVLPLEGTWRVEGSRLSVETDVGGFAGDYSIGGGGNLHVEGVGVLKRGGAVPPPPTPTPPTPDSGKGGNSLKGGKLEGDPPIPKVQEDDQLGFTDRIVGIWEWTGGGKKVTVYFRQGGRYTEVTEEGKKKEIEDGKWALSDGFFDITTGVFAPKTVTCDTPGFDKQGNMVWGEKTYRRLSGGSVTPVELSAQALLGRWVDEDDSGRAEYVFNAQGRFSEELVMSSGEAFSSYGPFEVTSGVIVLTNEVSGKSKRSPAKLPNRDHLDFEMAPGKTFTVYRVSSDPNLEVPGGGGTPPPPPPPPGGVAGTWLASGGGVSAEIVFNTDGSYSRQWTEAGQTTASKGTWKQEGSVLRIYDQLEGEELRIPYKLLTPDSLEITVDGEVLRLLRKGAKVQVPPELLGAWSARDQSGSIRLVMKPDATFIWDLSNTQQQWHFAGNFTHTPGTIHLVDTKTGGSYDLPYVFAQGLLTVTLDGNQIPMQKER